MMSVSPSPEKSDRNRSILSFLLASTRNTALTKSWSRVESDAMFLLIVLIVCWFFLQLYPCTFYRMYFFKELWIERNVSPKLKKSTKNSCHFQLRKQLKKGKCPSVRQSVSPSVSPSVSTSFKANKSIK